MGLSLVMGSVSALVKALQVWTAVDRVKEVYDKSDRSKADTLDAAIEAVFACLQVADMTFAGINGLSKLQNAPPLVQAVASKTALVTGKTFNQVKTTVRIGTNVAAVGCAISKPLAKRNKLSEEWLNILAVVAFRTSDGLEEFGEVRQWDPKKLENAQNVLITASEVIKKRQSVQHLMTAIGRRVSLIGARLREEAIRIRHGGSRDFSATQTTRSADQAPSADTRFGEEAARSMEASDEQVQAVVDGLDNNFQDLHEIPEVLYLHASMLQNRCCITGKPIRYIIVPCLTDEVLDEDPQLLDVKYERQAIEVWLQNSPHENPPRWPVQLPFNHQNFKSSPRLQRVIIENLSLCAREFQEVRNVLGNQ